MEILPTSKFLTLSIVLEYNEKHLKGRHAACSETPQIERFKRIVYFYHTPQDPWSFRDGSMLKEDMFHGSIGILHVLTMFES